jgi:hypothetical protein
VAVISLTLFLDLSNRPEGSQQPEAGANTPVEAAPPPVPAGTPVIGVSVNGRHRAYTLQALYGPGQHVYNDMLGGAPVTVTYCNLDDCVKVFTAPNRRSRLDVVSGGADRSRARHMLLQVGSTRYWQDTMLPLVSTGAAFPYSEMAFERTTWGEWSKAHPDSEVFVGDRPDGPSRRGGAP